MARYVASPFEQAYPLYAAIGMASGVFLGLNGAGVAPGAGLLLVGLGYAAYIFHAMRNLEQVRRWPHDWVWILFVFAGTGIFYGMAARPGHFDFEERRGTHPLVYGKVEEASVENYGSRLLIDVRGVFDTHARYTPLPGIRARVLTGDVGFRIGDLVVLDNRLMPVEKADYPGAMLHAAMLRSRGITYTSAFIAEGGVRHAGHEESVRDWFDGVRDEIHILLDHTPLSRDARGFMLAMLTGVKDDIPHDTREAFNHAGIAHILSVSGMHVGIVASTLWILLMPLAFLISLKKRMALVIAGIWVYALLCGMSPPVFRAAVMSTFLLAAAILERVNKSFSALCVSVIVILAAEPIALCNAGFQLSIATVGALVLFMRPVQKLYEGRGRATRYILSLAVASLIAVAGSWHLTTYYFHTLPLFFLPLNMLVVPLLPFIIFMGFVALMFNAAGIGTDWIYMIFNTAFSAIGRAADFAGGYYIDDIWLHWSGVALYSSVIIFIALAVHTRRHRFWGSFSLVLGSVALLLMAVIPPERPQDEIRLGNTYGTLAVHSYSHGKLQILHPMRARCTTLDIPGKARVAAVDCSRRRLLADGRRIEGCDYLLIGTMFDGSLSDLRHKFGDKPAVVLSALLSRRREASLARQCSLANVPCHVVRKSGMKIIKYGQLQ